jgi:uncharacterized protein YuzE
MKVKYDKEVDIVYILLNDMPVKESDEDKPDVIIDYAHDGSVVAIEILNASLKLPQPNKVEYETVGNKLSLPIPHTQLLPTKPILPFIITTHNH